MPLSILWFIFRYTVNSQKILQRPNNYIYIYIYIYICWCRITKEITDNSAKVLKLYVSVHTYIYIYIYITCTSKVHFTDHGVISVHVGTRKIQNFMSTWYFGFRVSPWELEFVMSTWNWTWQLEIQSGTPKNNIISSLFLQLCKISILTIGNLSVHSELEPFWMIPITTSLCRMKFIRRRLISPSSRCERR